ncbi:MULTISPECIES: glycosyltransferase [Flavobacteriaceae]|uniref:Glycosyltransferase n=2 Tax=Flavobacteriaceae TaxID=49546 RepID=A0A4Y8AVN6_9FLAO|nr:MULTISPECIES: glycosyltransferase [Flavobacteriaceae]TEW75432.1 glycosyltransferase [Gramella jeungdoensis]GGK45158.1 glycosyl transferase family 2 [Lutibacter litoralis]
MELQFSIIVPVYNRPQEIDELLQSLTTQSYQKRFEVIVIEDGSTIKAEEIVKNYSKDLNLKYFFKENSGAGTSRNYGMQQASGNYFIIFDSDCIIPSKYLVEVEKALSKNYTDAFGGADAAHDSFTTIQKAINYSMTSFFTTGGIRGSKKAVNKFQPRSFNLGISKKAFDKTQGFNRMKIGEDIDLTFRLWEHNFETQFIENAFVYHKRRTTFRQFFKQTFAFGKGRPFLNRKYPETAKITYWFPTLFILTFIFSILLLLINIKIAALAFAVYFIIVFLDSLLKNKNIKVAIFSVLTTLIQFLGYGFGFLKGLSKTE